MSDHANTFDYLFDELERFSPDIDESDLFVPNVSSSSQNSSLIPPTSSYIPISSSLRIVSQNVMKSNVAIHSLLSVSSSRPFTADIILIQEPWFGRIGIDVITGKDILGTPSHRDWMCILPTHGDLPPDVAIYVPKSRNGWQIQVRSDLFSHPSIIAVDIITGLDTFLLINVYNPADCSSLGPIIHFEPNRNIKCLIAGDFNLHHPLWSKHEHYVKFSEESELLVDSMSLKGFLPLNSPGIETFFRKDYSSVLDLVWISSSMSAHISDFKVNHPMHSGSDHYPLTWSILFVPFDTGEINFLFKDDKEEAWMDEFEKNMKHWNFPSPIPDIPTLSEAIETLTNAMSLTSKSICSRKPRSPKSAKWFDENVNKSLRTMRQSRQRSRIHPSSHNLLRYQSDNANFRYQVKRAKRSHAMSFAAGVASGKRTTADLWRLNSWYRGIRKTVTPSLKRPDLSWASTSQEKVSLLSETWFPPPAILPDNFSVPLHSSNPLSRPFVPVTNEEIDNALKGTSNTSAPGLSGLNYKVLKWAQTSCTWQFNSVIEASVRLGFHHSFWKSSLVVAIPKPNKKDYSLPRSHRPIQLIECLGKLVEKVVTKRLIFDIGKYNLMPFNQFGGRSNASCLDAALSLTHDIHEGRHRGLVSSFLAIDIKGFFDHVNHDRLVSVLWDKGFPPEICRWVKSFLSDRTVKIRIDDYTSPLTPLRIGVPQGSPASPALSCIYSSSVLESFNSSPIFSGTGIPITARSYIDDVGFLAISDSLHENVIVLNEVLNRAQKLFTSIGMKIDPDKCDLMHFSWRRFYNSSPSLHATINGVKVTITPPKFIRWLGFYLDRKLTFNDHVKIMAAKGSNVISGLTCLGNTITGMNAHHLRLLYKTCVIPVITYGCQLWFRPYAKKKSLLKKLQTVQNKGLKRVTGAFKTTLSDALPLLSFQPPIDITIHKLCDSTAIRFFRLPLHSEISFRLPKSFIPPSDITPRPKHVPFPRPCFRSNPLHDSFLTSLSSSIDPATERSEPYHSHNAPHAFSLSHPLFAYYLKSEGFLKIDHKPCAKKNRKSLVSKHNIFFLKSMENRSRLIVFTDGSRMPSGCGYGVVGFHLGKQVFKISVPFAKKASNYDAEMYALGHASSIIKRFVLSHPFISSIRIFSDATSAIEKIFDASPHPSQAASILFRTNLFDLFTARPTLKFKVLWTPGHSGTKGMKTADNLAKQGSKSKKSPLLSFTSRSAALSELETNTLLRWRQHIDDHPISEKSGFFEASQSLHPHLRPPKWFKNLDRQTWSRVTQFATGHGYTGEYYNRFVKSNDTFCSCTPPGWPGHPVFHSRVHIIKDCPFYAFPRAFLEKTATRVCHQGWSIGKLLLPQHIEHFIQFLSKSGAFTKGHAPRQREPP
jgi:ribonuclease HI